MTVVRPKILTLVGFTIAWNLCDSKKEEEAAARKAPDHAADSPTHRSVAPEGGKKDFAHVRRGGSVGVIVPAGDSGWVPSVEVVTRFETGLQRYLYSDPVAREKWIPQQLRYYRRQYAGTRGDGRKILFVDFFCKPVDGFGSRIVAIQDGGDCFFSIEFDVAEGSYSFGSALGPPLFVRLRKANSSKAPGVAVECRGAKGLVVESSDDGKETWRPSREDVCEFEQAFAAHAETSPPAWRPSLARTITSFERRYKGTRRAGQEWLEVTLYCEPFARSGGWTQDVLWVDGTCHLTASFDPQANRVVRLERVSRKDWESPLRLRGGTFLSPGGA